MEASRSPPVWPPIAGWRPAARRRPLRHQPGSPVRRQRRVLPLLDCSAAGDADAAPGDTGSCRHLPASAVRRRLPLHVGARPPAHDGVRLRRREPAADRLFLLIVLIGEDEGLTPGQIGLLSAAVGVGTLVDSLASPWFRKVFRLCTILVLELWTWLAVWPFVVWPRAWVLAGWALVVGIAAPVADSVVVGYRLALTPDRLVGRVESVRTTISLVASPLGPLLAGWL